MQPLLARLVLWVSQCPDELAPGDRTFKLLSHPCVYVYVGMLMCGCALTQMHVHMYVHKES